LFGIGDMRVALVILIALAAANTAPGVEADLQRLDPKKAEDRAVLLDIVRGSSNGESNQAARVLARAGYMGELLKILKTTPSYNTMQAIAQTQDERTIAIFEARLRADPENRYLIGSLTYVRSPKASPILVDLLERHRDSERPNDQDIVGCILNSMVFNRCQDAIPLLRERFASCAASSQADRKSDYALTLLSLGDSVGIPWLSQRLRADIEQKAGHSWTADRLATLCDWMAPRSDIVEVQDESIAAPLLPALVCGASSPGCPFARECVRVLRVLTRHDFAVGDVAWQEWYSTHVNKHPIYSAPLDRVAMLCADDFRERLADAARTDGTLKWMDHFLGQPQNGFGAHNDFLWKLESHPESYAIPMLQETPPLRGERETLGLVFVVALTSRLQEPAGKLFRKDFTSINVSVCLGSHVEYEGTKQLLVRLAAQACEVLSVYERHHHKAEDAEPSAPRGQP